MELIERIKSLHEWGKRIQTIPSAEIDQLFEKAQWQNGWFTQDSCQRAVREICDWLSYDPLVSWMEPYKSMPPPVPKSVGLVMAGNIPLVGFHDLLSVLITGQSAQIKMSSQDDVLLPHLTKLLTDSDAYWNSRISYADRLDKPDAVIATGSDNSSRHFEHYFKSIPRIIRKNRTSVGVILGDEPSEEFELLSDDVFTYFGMGCRNVSKIFIPENFDLRQLKKPFGRHQKVISHNKFANNYNYQKSFRIVASKRFIDLGFLLLEESEELVSPIAVMYFQYYSSQAQLRNLLKNYENKLQCMVAAKAWFKGSVPFGKAQQPAPSDYADGVDTVSFLQGL